ncbi:MAG: hypothetical protein WC082_02830, partial [Victivallales bacterium]
MKMIGKIYYGNICCLILAVLLSGVNVKSENITNKKIKMIYYSPYGRNDMTLTEMQFAGINALSHVPYEKDFIKAANSYGVRVLPYVSLYKVANSEVDPSLLRHPFWRELDGGKHSEWFLIDEKGQIKRPFLSKSYCAGIEQSCCNHKSIINAYLKGVKNIMNLGCGGIFIDNIHPTAYCYGQKLGLHKHDWPEKNNAECFKTALQAVCKEVKKYGKDKLCVINPGTASDQWKNYGDAQMVENFIYQSHFQVELNRGNFRCRPYWNKFKSTYNDFHSIQTQNDVLAYTLLSDPCSADESAFFSFVFAKLMNISWSATSELWLGAWTNVYSRRDIIRRLLRAEYLGNVRGEPVIKSDYGYRLFERGTVIINPTGKKLTLTIPAGLLKSPAELFSGQELEKKNGNVTIVMPPQTGRVILTKEAVLKNFLTEIKAELLASRQYIEDNLNRLKNQKFKNSKMNLLIELEAKVDSMLKNINNLTPENIDDLSLAITALKPNNFIEESSNYIRKNYHKLDQAKLEELLQKSIKIHPRLETYMNSREGRMIIRTAGVAYILPYYTTGYHTPYEPSAIMEYGNDTFWNLLSGPIPRAGASKEEWIGYRDSMKAKLYIKRTPEMQTIKDDWLSTSGLRSIKVIKDNLSCKIIEGIMGLYGTKSKKTVKDFYLQILTKVEKGSPFLQLKLTVVKQDGKNFRKLKGASLEFKLHHKLQFSNSGGTIRNHQLQSADWFFLCDNESSLTGTLLFGNPRVELKNGYVVSNNGELNFRIAPVSGDEYYFLKERFRNIKLYTSLTAQLMHNCRLKIEVPAAAVPGEKLPIDVSLTGLPQSAIKRIDYSVNGEVASITEEKTIPLQIKKRKQASALLNVSYSSDKLAGFKKDDIIYISCSALVTMVNGKRFVLQNFKMLRIKEPFKVDFVQTGPSGKTGSLLAVAVDNRSVNSIIGEWQINATDKIKLKPNNFELNAKSAKTFLFNAVAPDSMLNKAIPCRFLIKANGKVQKDFKFDIKFSPMIHVPYFAHVPKLDGDLSEKIWKEAALATSFGNYANGTYASPNTQVFIGYGKSALYVGFRCYDPDMKQLVSQAIPDRNGFSSQATRDDSIEIYLRP